MIVPRNTPALEMARVKLKRAVLDAWGALDSEYRDQAWTVLELAAVEFGRANDHASTVPCADDRRRRVVKCSACGFTRPHHGRGLCAACYQRARKEARAA